MDGAPRTQQPSVIGEPGLQSLFQVLERRGYRIVGSTIRDQAIVYDDIASPADLPRGWTDEQDGGRYRLVRSNDCRVSRVPTQPTLDSLDSQRVSHPRDDSKSHKYWNRRGDRLRLNGLETSTRCQSC